MRTATAGIVQLFALGGVSGTPDKDYNMSSNDRFEMDSMNETEDEGDPQYGMIEEQVGERTLSFTGDLLCWCECCVISS